MLQVNTKYSPQLFTHKSQASTHKCRSLIH